MVEGPDLVSYLIGNDFSPWMKWTTNICNAEDKNRLNYIYLASNPFVVFFVVCFNSLPSTYMRYKIMFDVQTWQVFVCSKYQESEPQMRSEVQTATPSHHTASRATSGSSWNWMVLWRKPRSVPTATQCAYGHAARSIFFLLTARKWSFKDPCLHTTPSLFFLNLGRPYNGALCLETFCYCVLESIRDVSVLV
jgi:hypothetical protein